MKKVQVLGTGCAKCNMLYQSVNQVVSDGSLDCEVIKVEDIKDIVSMGVMNVPALVVDGEVKATGRVPSAGEIHEMIS